MDTHRRIPSFIPTTLVAYCLSTPAFAAPPPGPLIACQNSVCLLTPAGIDSDGDGFSDEDEIAAGSDPNDATSRPLILKLIDGWRTGQMMPAEGGFREVVVLPEKTPDGETIGKNALPKIPGRKDAMERLGLTDGRLAGLDLSNGARAVLDLAAGLKSGGTEVPVRVGGINISLIADFKGETIKDGGYERTDWYDEKGNWRGSDETLDLPDKTVYRVCDETGCIERVVDKPRNSYVDPDNDAGLPPGKVIVLTPEMIEHWRMLRGTNTTPGPETQDPIADGSAPRTYDPLDPTIIYLDPSNDQVWWTPDPNGEPDFDKFGGNVNGGRPDGPTGPLNGCLPTSEIPCP